MHFLEDIRSNAEVTRQPHEQFKRVDRLSTRTLIAATTMSIVLLATVNNTLNTLYVRSGFPVPYAKGQTSFDGVQVKQWYATMSDAGTLHTYVTTQIFDFAFIAAVALTGVFVGSLIVRLAAGEGRLRNGLQWLGRLIQVVVPLGACFDTAENLFSFVMLARPSKFWDGWAVLQSTAAVTKFAFIATGMLATLVCVIGLVGAGIRARSTRSVNAQ